MCPIRLFATFGVIVVCTTLVHAAPIKVMPMGDQITEGYDNGENYGGYRPTLLSQLTAQGTQIQYQGIWDDGSNATLTAQGQGDMSGVAGFSTQDIFNNLNGSVPPTDSKNSNQGGYWMTGGNGTGRGALDPDIVLLISGANDSGGETQTQTYWAKILAWFAAYLPKTEVIVAAPPPGDWGYEGSRRNWEDDDEWLQSYVPANYPQDRVADDVDPFLNPDGTINGNLIPKYSEDPTEAGYQVLANVFDAAIQASIPEPSSIALIAAAGVLSMRRFRTNPKA